MLAATPPQLTDRGAAFVAAFEGFEPQCYDDGGRPGEGNCTIGYGHLIHYGPTTRTDRARWGTISRAYAIVLLRRDAARAAEGVHLHVKVPLARYQRDALISLVLNSGDAPLEGNVGRAVNARPRLPGGGRRVRWRQTVAAAMLEWDHVGSAELPGLRNRREAEGDLFETGRYSRADGNTHSHLER